MKTEEILNKAKDILLPKDTSIDGVLLLNGKEYANVVRFSIVIPP